MPTKITSYTVTVSNQVNLAYFFLEPFYAYKLFIIAPSQEKVSIVNQCGP